MSPILRPEVVRVVADRPRPAVAGARARVVCDLRGWGFVRAGADLAWVAGKRAVVLHVPVGLESFELQLFGLAGRSRQVVALAWGEVLPAPRVPAVSLGTRIRGALAGLADRARAPRLRLPALRPPKG